MDERCIHVSPSGGYPPPPSAGYINTNKEVWGIVLNNMRLIENSLCLHISL